MTQKTLPTPTQCSVRDQLLSYRALEVADARKPQLDFSVCSDTPLQRGIAGGQSIRETLNFDGLDSSRLDRGTAPLLTDHSNKIENQIGRIVSARRETEHSPSTRNVVRVVAEFNLDDERSASVYKKVNDGMVRNVSIGYSPKGDGLVVRDADRSADGVEWDFDVTYNRWAINEVSFVAVPADSSVGIGRSAYSPELDTKIKEILEKRKMTEQTQPETAVATREAAPIEAVEAAIAAEASPAPETRAAEAPAQRIEAPADDSALKAEHAAQVERSKGVQDSLAYLATQRDLLRDHFNIDDETQGTLLKEVRENQLDETQTRALIMSMAEERTAFGSPSMHHGPSIHTKTHQFDFGRVMKRLIQEEGHLIDGLEGEQIKEFETSRFNASGIARNFDGKSVVVPHSAFYQDSRVREQIEANNQQFLASSPNYAMNQRVFKVGNSNPTGFHHEVFEENWLVKALVTDAPSIGHIKLKPGILTQDVVGVTESGRVSTYYLTDEDSERVESTGLSYGNRTLKWHSLYARVDVTLKSLDQSHFLMPEIMANIQRDMGVGINNAFLFGSGSAGQPTGCLEFSGTHAITNGTNGGAPDYSMALEMKSKIMGANANYRRGIYIMTPEAVVRMQATPRFTGSTGAVSDVIVRVENGMYSIDGYPVIIDNNLPKNGTAGTGTALHSAIFLDPMEVCWGMFSGMEIGINPFSGMKNSKLQIFARQAFDISPDHVKAIAIAEDINVTMP